METLHLPVCHETGVMILLGIAVSFLIKVTTLESIELSKDQINNNPDKPDSDFVKMTKKFKNITILNWQ